MSTGAAGMGFAATDIYQNGFTTSNSLDLAMSGFALTGFSFGIAAGYFILNTISLAKTDSDIGQHISKNNSAPKRPLQLNVAGVFNDNSS